MELIFVSITWRKKAMRSLACGGWDSFGCLTSSCEDVEGHNDEKGRDCEGSWNHDWMWGRLQWQNYIDSYNINESWTLFPPSVPDQFSAGSGLVQPLNTWFSLSLSFKLNLIWVPTNSSLIILVRSS